MEVAVDRARGRVTVQRVTCAHDCGLVVNPMDCGIRWEGNILQALSRSLYEEVSFDSTRITSVDFVNYPILRFPAVPSVEVALLNHPDQPAYGAGIRPSSRP